MPRSQTRGTLRAASTRWRVSGESPECRNVRSLTRFVSCVFVKHKTRRDALTFVLCCAAITTDDHRLRQGSIHRLRAVNCHESFLRDSAENWRSGNSSRTATPTPSPLKWRAEPVAPAPPQWAMIGGRAYCRFCSQVTCHRVRPRILAGGNQIGGESGGLKAKEWRNRADQPVNRATCRAGEPAGAKFQQVMR
jgi:hypothetical protein